MQSTKTI